jgi:hypothetical protein
MKFSTQSMPTSSGSIGEAVLKYIEDLEAVRKLIKEGRKDARVSENELCARLVEEHGHKDLAALIRDSVRW